MSDSRSRHEGLRPMGWSRSKAGMFAGLMALACATTGTTYAAFSDYDLIPANGASAATVVIGGPGALGPSLEFPGLVPGDPKTQVLTVSYVGTIPADLAIAFAPDGGTEFCQANTDGSLHALDGGAVQIATGGSAWVDYCSLLASGDSLPLQDDVAPGTDLTVEIHVRLTPESDFRFSEISDVDAVTITARQSGAAGSFTDFVEGSISIGTAEIKPPVPAHCAAAGLLDFDASNTFVLTPGDDVFAPPQQPDHGDGYLVLGLGGADVITGSNHGDCIDGGEGVDTLTGGNQHDVLIGGAGSDHLFASEPNVEPVPGGNGRDLLYGGSGDDFLFGANAKDSLFGEEGNDVLQSGRGTDLWDGGPDTDECLDPEGVGEDPMFVSCELPAEVFSPFAALLTERDEPAPAQEDGPDVEATDESVPSDPSTAVSDDVSVARSPEPTDDEQTESVKPQPLPEDTHPAPVAEPQGSATP